MAKKLCLYCPAYRYPKEYVVLEALANFGYSMKSLFGRILLIYQNFK